MSKGRMDAFTTRSPNGRVTNTAGAAFRDRGVKRRCDDLVDYIMARYGFAEKHRKLVVKFVKRGVEDAVYRAGEGQDEEVLVIGGSL